MPEKGSAGAGEPGADLIGDWDANWRKMSQSRCASRPNLTAQFPLEISFGGVTYLRVLPAWGCPALTRPSLRGCGVTGSY